MRKSGIAAADDWLNQIGFGIRLNDTQAERIFNIIYQQVAQDEKNDPEGWFDTGDFLGRCKAELKRGHIIKPCYTIRT